MNNYIKLLDSLDSFAGDGQFHKVHSLLESMGFNTDEKKRSFLFELSSHDLINFDGGSKGSEISFSSESGRKTFGGFWEKEFEAKITIKGSEYLKENKPKNDTGVSINGNNNQVVLGSHNFTVYQSQEIDDLIKNIKDIISRDQNLAHDYKMQSISAFEQLQSEVTEKKISKGTWSKIISIGSDISSIASLLLMLAEQIRPILP
jgi:hypothetical protein